MHTFHKYHMGIQYMVKILSVIVYQQWSKRYLKI